MKEIILTQNKVVLVDDEDFERLNQYKWYAHKPPTSKTWYAYRKSHRQLIMMHKEILNPPNGYLTDHINGNGLDNRKQNLRISNPSQSGANRRIHKNNSSGFKGVTFHQGRWRATIKVNGRSYHGGEFDDKIQAALKYNELAERHFGDFASLNTI